MDSQICNKPQCRDSGFVQSSRSHDFGDLVLAPIGIEHVRADERLAFLWRASCDPLRLAPFHTVAWETTIRTSVASGGRWPLMPRSISAAFKPLARYYREFVDAGGLMSYLPTVALS